MQKEQSWFTLILSAQLWYTYCPFIIRRVLAWVDGKLKVLQKTSLRICSKDQTRDQAEQIHAVTHVQADASPLQLHNPNMLVMSKQQTMPQETDKGHL